MSEAQEAQYRAKGYVVQGEQVKMSGFQQFPAWVKKGDEEKLVNDQKQYEAARADGFDFKIKPDPDAFEQAFAAPGVRDMVIDRSRRYENGILIEEPDEDDLRANYPRYIRRDGKEALVNTPEEEAATWELWGGDPSVPVLSLGGHADVGELTPIVTGPDTEPRKMTPAERMAKARAARGVNRAT